MTPDDDSRLEAAFQRMEESARATHDAVQKALAIEPPKQLSITTTWVIVVFVSFLLSLNVALTAWHIVDTKNARALTRAERCVAEIDRALPLDRQQAERIKCGLPAGR